MRREASPVPVGICYRPSVYRKSVAFHRYWSMQSLSMLCTSACCVFQHAHVCRHGWHVCLQHGVSTPNMVSSPPSLCRRPHHGVFTPIMVSAPPSCCLHPHYGVFTPIMVSAPPSWCLRPPVSSQHSTCASTDHMLLANMPKLCSTMCLRRAFPAAGKAVHLPEGHTAKSLRSRCQKAGICGG